MFNPELPANGSPLTFKNFIRLEKNNISPLDFHKDYWISKKRFYLPNNLPTYTTIRVEYNDGRIDNIFENYHGFGIDNDNDNDDFDGFDF